MISGRRNRKGIPFSHDFTSFSLFLPIFPYLYSYKKLTNRNGQSVAIRGFGTFQTALTSKGFEHPGQVTPGEVSVSKVYFMADRNLLRRLKKVNCYRIPLSYDLPKELLTPEILEEEKGLKEEGRI